MPEKFEKSILVFTNFWDADFLIGNGHLQFKYNDSICKLNLDIINQNFVSQSVALSSPPLRKFKNFKSMERIDELCPTYKMLCDYKSDKDWDQYTSRYMELLNNRKDKLKEWMKSLKSGKIYLLCCWENTSGKSKCHRKIIYDVIKSSRNAMDKVVPIYRDGNGLKEII